MFHACVTLMFKREKKGGQNIMDFEVVSCFTHVLL